MYLSLGNYFFVTLAVSISFKCFMLELYRLWVRGKNSDEEIIGISLIEKYIVYKRGRQVIYS